MTPVSAPSCGEVSGSPAHTAYKHTEHTAQLSWQSVVGLPVATQAQSHTAFRLRAMQHGLLVRPDVLHIGLFMLLVILVSFIFTAFMVILCSLAFFLGNTEGLSQQMLGALVSFATYPMDIFHGAVRLLLFTVVPAGFISFIPLQLLHRFTWPLIGAMVGFTALMVAIAVGVFELGLRRYESGNLLGMQG